MARMKPGELLQRAKGRKANGSSSGSSRGGAGAGVLSVACLSWSIAALSLLAFIAYLLSSRFLLHSPKGRDDKGQPLNMPLLLTMRTAAGVILLRLMPDDCPQASALLLHRSRANYFKDASLQAASTNHFLLVPKGREARDGVAFIVAPPGAARQWSGNCSLALPAMQLSGSALLQALASHDKPATAAATTQPAAAAAGGAAAAAGDSQGTAGGQALPFLRVERVMVTQSPTTRTLSQGIATIR